MQIKAHSCRQRLNVVITQLHIKTTAQTAWQLHRAVANADQTADGVADALNHAAHLAVAAFIDRDFVPMVGAFATTFFDATELGHAIVELHAAQQLVFFNIAECAQNAHSVFAL